MSRRPLAHGGAGAWFRRSATISRLLLPSTSDSRYTATIVVLPLDAMTRQSPCRRTPHLLFCGQLISLLSRSAACRSVVGGRSTGALGVLSDPSPAEGPSENDDVGAVHDDDEERTYPAGLVATVASWSSNCRQPVACAPVRRRHGGVWLRAREDPAGAGFQPGRAGAGRAASWPWVIWPISVHGGTCGKTLARSVSAGRPARSARHPVAWAAARGC
jgi:hypothetical protein